MRSAITVTALALVAGCGGTPAPARTRVVPNGPASFFVSLEHRSEMSASFDLVRLRALLDGAQVDLREVPDPHAETVQPLPTPACLARRLVQAGTHEIAVEIGYRGHGFGIFSYLRGYGFTVRSRTRVDVPSDAFGAVVTSTAYEGGGATAPLEDRPRIRWDVHVERQQPGAGCYPRLLARR